MQNLNDLRAFVLVAKYKSFTKAGEKLGVSASAVSHCLSNLENRLNIRLLNRTTRSISPTPEGLMLLNDISPYLQAIDLSIKKLSENQDNITGTVRINASQVAIEMAILPKLAPIFEKFPHIHIELHSENRFVDIVGEGFDMGVRLGDNLAKDMVAVKISPPFDDHACRHAQLFAKQRNSKKKSKTWTIIACLLYAWGLTVRLWRGIFGCVGRRCRMCQRVS